MIKKPGEGGCGYFSPSPKRKASLDITPPKAYQNIRIQRIRIASLELYTYSILNPHQSINKTGDLYPNDDPGEQGLRLTTETKNHRIPYYEDENGVVCFFTPSFGLTKRNMWFPHAGVFKGGSSGAAHVLRSL